MYLTHGCGNVVIWRCLRCATRRVADDASTPTTTSLPQVQKADERHVLPTLPTDEDTQANDD